MQSINLIKTMNTFRCRQLANKAGVPFGPEAIHSNLLGVEEKNPGVGTLNSSPLVHMKNFLAGVVSSYKITDRKEA
jgi:hypothetical protein